MTSVTFHNPADLEDSLIKFSVIAARYQEKWIFCRHKARSTWEIPGGHREEGETALEAARRELYEETGALEAEILPVCAYGVTRNGGTSYGMLYFAEVSRLEPLPGMEIGETALLDVLPESLTYPDIQPMLYDRVQAWLNIRSGAGEIWDIYDKNRQKTGKFHRRGDPLAPGEYHLVVHVWIQNPDGRFLLTKRSPNKGFPNLWEATGGSALAGDDSLTAALREVEEETGLVLQPENGRIIHKYSGADYHTDVWLFRQDFDLEGVRLLEGETCGKTTASAEDILTLEEARKIVPYGYVHDWMERKHMVSVYQAGSQDAEVLSRLAVQLWPGHSILEMENEFSELLSGENAAVFLLSHDGEAMGFAQCQLRRDYVEGTSTSPVGYLEGIFVVPNHRRKGYARRLLSACEAWAKELGCREFASDCELTNGESLDFHIRAGFLEANRIICFIKDLR